MQKELQLTTLATSYMLTPIHCLSILVKFADNGVSN